jgi:(E)-4-hydroxy-3-methylbut-2-enyl-diphosphate synthase
MEPWRYDGLAIRRRPTRVVRVGEVGVGGDNPIRIQSMTTPATRDVAATVGQIARLVEAGCEIVRVTVPTTADAESLPGIREELGRLGVKVPLVADIHFTPAVALKAVEHVEKIRINPGNFADKKKFSVREYTDSEYGAELERIEAVFSPLVLRAKELGVSMRIGTNHGSLSDRIMNRYGDTPEGMVESALEFVRICEGHDYRDLILSMKSSNPVVALQVYRLLAQRMAEAGMDYPFHLGVTEAGEGEEARIKSAIGIGALLAEGIGDTIRVSLTEDPVREIPVARALAAPYEREWRRAAAGNRPALPDSSGVVRESRDPFRYERRASRAIRVGPHELGGNKPVRVEVALRAGAGEAEALRLEIDAEAGPRVLQENRAEIVVLTARSEREVESVEQLRKSLELTAPAVALSVRPAFDPLEIEDDPGRRRWLMAGHRLELAVRAPLAAEATARLDGWLAASAAEAAPLLVEVGSAEGELDAAIDLARKLAEAARSSGDPPLMLALAPASRRPPMQATRRLAARLAGAGLAPPLLLLDRPEERGVDPLLGCSAALGGLLCDGIGDSVRLETRSPGRARTLAFGLLQAARVRITRTEFISCPSCGRTLFDLEETTARIRARTSHLKGVKIAVMGCVVNGPGEMADADFGYVGWGENKIALFVGKEMVARDIPTAEAEDRLVELIRQHGRWTDPPRTDNA